MIPAFNDGVVQQRSVVAKDRKEIEMVKGAMWFHGELKHTVWFRANEFQCPCCDVELMEPDFIRRLDQLRHSFALPLRITSGFRCAKYNAEIGGAKFSLHTDGLAADIACQGSEYRHSLLYHIMACKFGGVGIYKKHIHVDMRRMAGRNAVWLGGMEQTDVLSEVA